MSSPDWCDVRTLSSLPEMNAWLSGARESGARIGLVPTMGFLHRGHSGLMDLIRPRCDRLVVSVFVNPLQFGPSEDLARYPRDPEGDAALCERHGVDVVFSPEAFYPTGFSTAVSVGGVSDRLEGRSRPGHFEGVATVCARLFGVVGAEIAAFGEKDWQQLAVIRRMVADLALPVEIVAGALVRDEDGVALSSRNAYLTAPERVRARTLYRALSASGKAFRAGERAPSALVAVGLTVLEADSVDYFEVVDGQTLAPVVHAAPTCRVLVAAKIGGTRLIDNLALGAG